LLSLKSTKVKAFLLPHVHALATLGTLAGARKKNRRLIARR
jgi:hypothetical protein